MTDSGLLVGGAIAVLLLLVIAVVVVRGLRKPGIQLRELSEADIERYQATFASIEGEAETRPEQAAARARGLVEEVLRRLGFPDRVDSAQKARDVARYDRDCSQLLREADLAIREPGASAEAMKQVVGRYREALNLLLSLHLS
ncbi:MAG: hypothetical protein QOE92_1144 [Chloroflexota bacterium]|nr:hypothetical protein [Chloroflexota bacterium]